MPDDRPTVALAFYNAARAEVIQRLSLREQVLLAYLATSGVIAGLAFKTPAQPDPNVLLLIPVLSLPFALAFIRHDWIIRYVGRYISKELRSFVKGEYDGKTLVDWDGSQSLGQELRTFLIVEKLIFTTLICGPAIISICLSSFRVDTLLWLSIAAIATTCVVCVLFICEVTRVIKAWKTGG